MTLKDISLSLALTLFHDIPKLQSTAVATTLLTVLALDLLWKPFINHRLNQGAAFDGAVFLLLGSLFTSLCWIEGRTSVKLRYYLIGYPIVLLILGLALKDFVVCVVVTWRGLRRLVRRCRKSRRTKRRGKRRSGKVAQMSVLDHDVEDDAEQPEQFRVRRDTRGGRGGSRRGHSRHRVGRGRNRGEWVRPHLRNRRATEDLQPIITPPRDVEVQVNTDQIQQKKKNDKKEKKEKKSKISKKSINQNSPKNNDKKGQKKRKKKWRSDDRMEERGRGRVIKVPKERGRRGRVRSRSHGNAHPVLHFGD